MKKLSLITLSVALFGATSCTEEIIVQNSGAKGEPIELTFTASNGEMNSGVNTRSLIREGGNVLWVANDRISLFANGTNNPFITKDGGVVTNFKGTVDETADTYYAVYPYNSDATIDGNTISTVLYTYQYAEPNSFASGMNLSVSRSSSSDGQNLAFLHSASYLRVEIADNYSGDAIRSMRLRGNNNEYLAGNVTISVDMSDYSAHIVEDEKASHTVYLDPINDGETLLKGKNYYFVLAPQTMQNGYTLTLVNEAGDICEIEKPGPIEFNVSQQEEITIESATFEPSGECGQYTEDGLYKVTDLACLYDWAKLVADGDDDLGCYIIPSEIDFADATENWPVLGDVDKPYIGTIKGNGVVIKNFKINTDSRYAGFIGALGAEGSIENLNFDTPTISSSYEGDVESVSDDGYVGVIVGLLNRERTNNLTSGVIKNCTVTNPNVSGGENVGGIVGRSFGRNDAITGCSVSGGTISGHMFVGGIIGNSEGIIENCHVKAGTTISYHDTQSEARVGGIVGTNNSGQIVACTANAVVNGSAGNDLDARYTGGIAGANNGTILGCAFNGTASGDYTGGIAGESYGDVIGCYAMGTAKALVYKIKKNLNDAEDVTLPVFTASYWVGTTGAVIGESEENGTITDCSVISSISALSTEVETMNNALTAASVNTEYEYGATYQYSTNSGDDAQTFPVKATKPQ